MTNHRDQNDVIRVGTGQRQPARRDGTNPLILANLLLVILIHKLNIEANARAQELMQCEHEIRYSIYPSLAVASGSTRLNFGFYFHTVIMYMWCHGLFF